MMLDARYLSHIQHFRPRRIEQVVQIRRESSILVTAVLWRENSPLYRRTPHHRPYTFSLLSEILSQRKLIEEINRVRASWERRERDDSSDPAENVDFW